MTFLSSSISWYFDSSYSEKEIEYFYLLVITPRAPLTSQSSTVRASPTVLLMRDLGPTSAAREPFLASSGAAEQAADGRGGGSELPLAATFGSFGSSPSKLLQPTLAVSMPTKTMVLDPLLASMTPNAPTPTTRTMPRTQPDPNSTPKASATEPEILNEI
ncbi:hypothetical protein PGTUg99_011084 [Puccinia graminis f. sp. tritici]|uniref:Uncharacterized protein n=1 Tax=Puccinia graminis f. sp. tritici TaxID=56615 RepID=A0A5B0S2V4_PUCGR|nr:hypothetical protein PGTUg99_011084 [Puccinia graminis f. sp. tritici]